MARMQNIRPRVIVKKKGGFVGKIVAFFMGMIMGVSAIIGSVAAVGYFVLKKPLNEIFSTVESTGANIPGDLLDYVNEDLATLTLLDALKTVGSTAIGLKDGAKNVGDLVNLSPFLDKNLGNLINKAAEFGISITKEEILALNLTNAGGYLVEKIYNTPIADIINTVGSGVSGNDALMCSLYYGKKGVHYTVNEENKAVALPLTYVLNENVFTDWDKKVFEKIGEEWIHENVSLGVKTIIKEYQAAPANEGGLTYSYEVYEVSGETQTLLYQLVQDAATPSNYHAYKNGVIQKHKGLTIGAVVQGTDIITRVNQMELFSVLNMNSSTPSILLSLAGYEKDENGLPVLKEGKSATTINDLKGQNATNLINDMKLSEVLSLNSTSDPIMLSLAHGNYTIDNGVVKPEVKDGKPVDRTISDLINDGGAQELIQTLKLPVVLKLNNTSNKLLLKIAYGEGYSENASGTPVLDDSKARSVADLTKGDFLDPLTIGDVIDTTKEDTPHILKFLANATIGGEGENTLASKIENLTLVDALGEEKCASSMILTTMKDWKINDFSTNVQNLKLEDIITITDDSPAILKALKGESIGGNAIANKINILTLKEIIGDEADTNFILKHLKNSTLTSISEDISKLAVEDVFADDVYKKAYFNEDNELISTLLYKNPTDGKYYTDKEYTLEYAGTVNEYFLGDCNHALKKNVDGTFSHVGESNSSCEGKLVLTGTWFFLLTDSDPAANTHPEKKHYLTNMALLVDNMTYNVRNATLFELTSNGLLELKEETLAKTLPGSTNPIGELTVKELIEVLDSIAS